MRALLTTRYGAVRPLSVKGQRVLDLQQQLVRLVARRSGDPDASLLFAQPRIVESSDRITWDTTADGPIRRLVDVDPSEQAAGYGKYQAAEAAVRKVIDELAGSGNERSRLDAELLEAALSHSGDSDIFLVGDRPVLVNWGCEPAPREAGAVKLTHAVRRPPEELDQDRTVEKPTRHETLALPKTEEVVARTEIVRAASSPWRYIWLGFLAFLVIEVFAVGHFTGNARTLLEAARVEAAGAKTHLASLAGRIVDRRGLCTLPALGDQPFADRLQQIGVGRHPVLITLLWDHPVLVELRVRTPSGTEIGGATWNAEGTPLALGKSDISDKALSVSTMSADQKLPPGQYTVSVRLASAEDAPADPISYAVRIAIDGKPPVTVYGFLRSVDKWQSIPVAYFQGGS